MIEYTIKNYFDFFVMTGFYKSSQIFVCSKTGVQFFVICCLIAMADTFEERSDIQGCASDFFDMVDPWKKSVQAMYRFCVLILFGSTGKAKWINVIKNCFIIPTHVLSSRFVVVWGIDIKSLDKSMGLSLNGSPFGFAIYNEIITEDQQQQVLYQQHFLRI